jgi:hypothetical protein
MCLKSNIRELYHEHGMRMQEIADQLGISPVEVSNWLEHGHKKEPDPAPLLGVGPPNDRLYKQGICAGCQIPLFGGDPSPREWCGECDPRGKLL